MNYDDLAEPSETTTPPSSATIEPVGDELIEWEGALWPVKRQAGLSEDAYAAAEVEVTRLAHLKDPDGRREERCDAYARWRYRGYIVGEIRSL
jgi:hypothetical protein